MRKTRFQRDFKLMGHDDSAAEKKKTRITYIDAVHQDAALSYAGKNL